MMIKYFTAVCYTKTTWLYDEQDNCYERPKLFLLITWNPGAGVTNAKKLLPKSF